MDNRRPFTFAEVEQVYKNLTEGGHPFFSGMTLPEFSSFMAEEGHPEFGAGMSEGFLTKVSSFIDKFLRPAPGTPAHYGLSKSADWLTSKLAPKSWLQPTPEGEPSPVYEVLREPLLSLPRELPQLALLSGSVASMAAKRALGLSDLVKAGAGGLGAYSRGYTDTGSHWGGLINTLSTAATIPVAESAKAAVAPALAKIPWMVQKTGNIVGPTTSPVAHAVARGVETTAANLANIALTEASLQATSLATTGQLQDVTDPVHLATVVGGNLPFAILDAKHVFRGPPMVDGRFTHWPSVFAREQTIKARTDAAKDYEAKVNAQVASALKTYEEASYSRFNPLEREDKTVDVGGVQVPLRALGEHSKVRAIFMTGPRLSESIFRRLVKNLKVEGEAQRLMDEGLIKVEDVGDERVVVADPNFSPLKPESVEAEVAASAQEFVKQQERKTYQGLDRLAEESAEKLSLPEKVVSIEGVSDVRRLPQAKERLGWEDTSFVRILDLLASRGVGPTALKKLPTRILSDFLGKSRELLEAGNEEGFKALKQETFSQFVKLEELIASKAVQAPEKVKGLLQDLVVHRGEWENILDVTPDGLTQAFTKMGELVDSGAKLTPAQVMGVFRKVLPKRVSTLKDLTKAHPEAFANLKNRAAVEKALSESTIDISAIQRDSVFWASYVAELDAVVGKEGETPETVLDRMLKPKLSSLMEEDEGSPVYEEIITSPVKSLHREAQKFVKDAGPLLDEILRLMRARKDRGRGKTRKTKKTKEAEEETEKPEEPAGQALGEPLPREPISSFKAWGAKLVVSQTPDKKTAIGVYRVAGKDETPAFVEDGVGWVEVTVDPLAKKVLPPEEYERIKRAKEKILYDYVDLRRSWYFGKKEHTVKSGKSGRGKEKTRRVFATLTELEAKWVELEKQEFVAATTRLSNILQRELDAAFDLQRVLMRSGLEFKEIAELHHLATGKDFLPYPEKPAGPEVVSEAQYMHSLAGEVDYLMDLRSSIYRTAKLPHVYIQGGRPLVVSLTALHAARAKIIMQLAELSPDIIAAKNASKTLRGALASIERRIRAIEGALDSFLEDRATARAARYIGMKFILERSPVLKGVEEAIRERAEAIKGYYGEQMPSEVQKTLESSKTIEEFYTNLAVFRRRFKEPVPRVKIDWTAVRKATAFDHEADTSTLASAHLAAVMGFRPTWLESSKGRSFLQKLGSPNLFAREDLEVMALRRDLATTDLVNKPEVLAELTGIVALARLVLDVSYLQNFYEGVASPKHRQASPRAVAEQALKARGIDIRELGDRVRELMAFEKLTFSEALEKLAQEKGTSVEVVRFATLLSPKNMADAARRFYRAGFRGDELYKRIYGRLFEAARDAAEYLQAVVNDQKAKDHSISQSRTSAFNQINAYYDYLDSLPPYLEFVEPLKALVTRLYRKSTDPYSLSKDGVVADASRLVVRIGGELVSLEDLLATALAKLLVRQREALEKALAESESKSQMQVLSLFLKHIKVEPKEGETALAAIERQNQSYLRESARLFAKDMLKKSLETASSDLMKEFLPDEALAGKSEFATAQEAAVAYLEFGAKAAENTVLAEDTHESMTDSSDPDDVVGVFRDLADEVIGAAERVDEVETARQVAEEAELPENLAKALLTDISDDTDFTSQVAAMAVRQASDAAHKALHDYASQLWLRPYPLSGVKPPPEVARALVAIYEYGGFIRQRKAVGEPHKKTVESQAKILLQKGFIPKELEGKKLSQEERMVIARKKAADILKEVEEAELHKTRRRAELLEDVEPMRLAQLRGFRTSARERMVRSDYIEGLGGRLNFVLELLWQGYVRFREEPLVVREKMERTGEVVSIVRKVVTPELRAEALQLYGQEIDALFGAVMDPKVRLYRVGELVRETALPFALGLSALARHPDGIAAALKELGVEGVPSIMYPRRPPEVVPREVVPLPGPQTRYARGDLEGMLGVSSYVYFKKFFANQGHPPESVERLAQMAVRLSGAFRRIQGFRVGESGADSPFYGKSTYFGGRSGYIDLNLQRLVSHFPEPEIKQFLALDTFAHEMSHGLIDLWTHSKHLLPEPVLKAVEIFERYARTLTPDERALVIKKLFISVLPKKFRDTKVLTFIEHRADVVSRSDSGGFAEFMADFMGLWVLGLSEAKKTRKVGRLASELLFAEQAEADFAKGVFPWIRDFLEALAFEPEMEQYKFLFGETEAVPQARAAEISNALYQMSQALTELLDTSNVLLREHQIFVSNILQAAAPTVLREYGYKLRDTSKHVEKLASSLGVPLKLSEDEVARQILNDLSAHFSEVMNEEALDAPPVARSTLGKRVSFIDKYLTLPALLVEKFPAFAPLNQACFMARELGNQTAHAALSPFLVTHTKGKFQQAYTLDVETTGLQTLAESVRAREAAAKLAVMKVRREKTIDELGEAVGPVLANLSEKERQAVLHFHKATEKSLTIMADKIVEAYGQTNEHLLAMRLLVSGRYTADEAGRVAQKLLVGARNIASLKDPGDAMNMMVSLTEAPTPEESKFLSRTLDVASSMVEEEGRVMAMVKGRSWYFPQSRLGRFLVKANLGSKRLALSFGTEREALAKEKELTKKGFQVRVIDKEVDTFSAMDLPQEIVMALRSTEQAAFDKAVAGLDLPPDVREHVQKMYAPLERSMREAANESFTRHLMRRKGVAGAEHEDPIQQYFRYITLMSSGLSKKVAKAKAALVLADPAFQQNPEWLALGRWHAENVLSPPGKEWTKAKNALFLYYLAFNIPNMVVELGTQTPIITIPRVVKELVSGGVGGSGTAWKLFAETARDLMKYWRTGKFDDPLLEAVVDELKRRGVVGLGALHDVNLQQELLLTSLRDLETKGLPGFEKSAAIGRNLFAKLTNVSRKFYSKAPILNELVSAVLFYKVGVLLKKEWTQLPDYVDVNVRATQFTGGIAQRPVGYMHDAGKFHGALGLSLSLMTYTLGAYGTFFRYLKNSVKGSKADRKALLHMVTPLVLAAGIRGLPGIAVVIAILNQFFPELELKRKTREWALKTTTGIFGDESLGEPIADMAVAGVLGRLTGFDVGARIQLGSYIGVNPYEGIQPSYFLGPMAGLVERLIGGVKSAQEGNLRKAGETIAPAALRGFLDLLVDDWEFLDPSGRKVMEASTLEKVGHILGFRPYELGKIMEERKMASQANEVAAREMRSFHRRMAELVLAGKVKEAQAEMLAREAEDPLYNALAGARVVAEILYDRKHGTDFRREGVRAAAGARLAIEKAMGPRARYSEVQRLLEVKRLLSSMGLPVAVGKAELQRAVMVDQMLQANPGLNLQTVRAMIDRQLGKSLTQRLGGMTPPQFYQPHQF